MYLFQDREEEYPKVREGKRASDFGGEVHSDLWGKSPVEPKFTISCLSTRQDILTSTC